MRYVSDENINKLTEADWADVSVDELRTLLQGSEIMDVAAIGAPLTDGVSITFYAEDGRLLIADILMDEENYTHNSVALAYVRKGMLSKLMGADEYAPAVQLKIAEIR